MLLPRQDRVATPEPSFEGEEDPYYQGDGVAFLRLVTITMNCETPNVTIFYTTDGVTEPGDDSPLSVSPGSELIWSEEGTTTFKAIAFADGDLYKSDVNSWDVTITAPRIDEFGVAGVHGAGEWAQTFFLYMWDKLRCFCFHVVCYAERVLLYTRFATVINHVLEYQKWQHRESWRVDCE